MTGFSEEGTSDEKTARLLQYQQLYWYYSWLGVADEKGRLIATTDQFPPQGPKAWIRHL